MTQEEFDSLAIFVAVVEELKREPFFSEDNHDHLAGNVAVFCHPMFLKSAVLPFRKIWMERERCAFRKRDGTGGIRDLVFREFPDHILSGGLRYWFYEHYDSSLKTSFGYGWAKETKLALRELFGDALVFSQRFVSGIYAGDFPTADSWLTAAKAFQQWEGENK